MVQSGISDEVGRRRFCRCWNSHSIRIWRTLWLLVMGFRRRRTWSWVLELSQDFAKLRADREFLRAVLKLWVNFKFGTWAGHYVASLKSPDFHFRRPK